MSQICCAVLSCFHPGIRGPNARLTPTHSATVLAAFARARLSRVAALTVPGAGGWRRVRRSRYLMICCRVRSLIVVRPTLNAHSCSSGGRACLVAITVAGRPAPEVTNTAAPVAVRPDGAAIGPPVVGVVEVEAGAVGAPDRSAARPNPRLQRPGVFGRYWLVSTTEVMQVLWGWRVMARR